MINLQEAGQQHELGEGSLYAKLQRKIPEAMLAKYNRWVFEYGKEESVIALREWIIQESEFQTMATEAVRGLSGKSAKPPSRPTPRHGNQGHFSAKQSLVKTQKRCHASTVVRITGYGPVLTSKEEKWQIDGT